MQNFTGPGQVTPKGILYYGTDQADTINGTSSADEIHGGGGHDTIFAGAGDDKLYGDAGNDTLVGDVGNDTLDGGADNDILIGGAGADTLNGGAGFDTVSYADATQGVSVSFRSGNLNTGDAAGDTFVSIEKFVGSNYDDTFVAAGTTNVNFDGGAGGDWLQGAGGNDDITGGSGVDHLWGGAGYDKFYIAPNSGVDNIHDFQSGSDHLVLTGFGAHPLDQNGTLTAVNFGHALTAGDALTSTAPNHDFGTLWYSMYDHTLYSVQTQSADDGFFFHTKTTVTSATAVATFNDDSMLQHNANGNHYLIAPDLILQ